MWNFHILIITILPTVLVVSGASINGRGLRNLRRIRRDVLNVGASGNVGANGGSDPDRKLKYVYVYDGADYDSSEEYLRGRYGGGGGRSRMDYGMRYRGGGGGGGDYDDVYSGPPYRRGGARGTYGGRYRYPDPERVGFGRGYAGSRLHPDIGARNFVSNKSPDHVPSRNVVRPVATSADIIDLSFRGLLDT